VARDDVTVVPMDKEQILPHQTVVVEGGRITQVGSSGSVKVLSGTLKIDGAQENQALALLCAANGVTTVRNMWGDSVIDALGREIDSGPVLESHTPWVLSLMLTFQSGVCTVPRQNVVHLQNE
jgi:hypothetical protein